MSELPIITQAYDLVLCLVPQVAEFPKQQRYTLGERLEAMMLDLLSLLDRTSGYDQMRFYGL